MRLTLIVAWALVAVLAWPSTLAVAEVQPPEERVLMDMTVRVLPQQEYGICMLLEAGSVASTVQLTGERVLPVRFSFGAYENVEADRVHTLIATAPVTYVTKVEGGMYCYTLYNETPPPPDGRRYADEAVLRSQMVIIKLIWTPA